MAIKSGFFNSVNGDRKYNAGSFAEYFATFIGNGVFPNPSDNLQIIANNDMTVTVSPGKVWINGYILINDDDYILNIEPADGVLSRIDRIVARYDTADREIRLEVKQGAYSSSPVPQSLQRDADAYELGLADVLVSNGVISITQASITDLRLNTELCGIVHGTVDQVDTTSIFNQYQAWFNSITDGTEQQIADWQQQQYDDFMIWFQSIQDILEGDVAANLASRISSLENDFRSHLAEYATFKDGRVWDKIAKVTLTSNVAQVDFENLNLESYRHLKIIFSSRSSTTLANLNIRINGLTSNIYSWVRQMFNTAGANFAEGSSVSYIEMTSALDVSTGGFVFGEIEIDNVSIKNKTVNYSFFAPSYGRKIIGAGAVGTVPAITKISLIASSGNIGTGSAFTIMGVK